MRRLGALLSFTLAMLAPASAHPGTCDPSAIHQARADFGPQIDPQPILRVDPLPPGVSEAPGHSGPPYKTKGVLDRFLGENVQEPYGAPPVQYLGRGQAEFRRLRLGSDGLIYDYDGKLFDTQNAVQLFRDGTAYRSGGRAIFVMDANGNLWASNVQVVGTIHHSTLLAGGEVAAAGEIQVEHGVLKVISDKSGHYFPTRDQAMQFRSRLSEAWGSHFDPKKLEYDYYSPDPNAPPDAPATAPPPTWHLAPEPPLVVAAPRGMTSEEIEKAFEMRNGGGHAIRHLSDDANPPLIPEKGSLQSRVEAFKKVTQPILEHPVVGPVPGKVGASNSLRYLGKAPDGRWVLIQIAADGPHQGKILSAWVPNETQLKALGIVTGAAP